MEEDNFSKLKIEERCTHKNWKARISGYLSLAQLFQDLDEEHCSEWNTYVHIIRNIVTDINDPALEKGLEAVQIFVERYSLAGKTAPQVVPSLVKKCLASSRCQIRTLAVEISLMYIEIGQQDVVLFELLEGAGSRSPKAVSACINVIIKALKEFGPNIFEVNNLLVKVVSMLEDRDVNVRNSCKSLIVELYRWMGASVKPHLDHLKPSKLSEVMADIAKIQNLPPLPTRFLRSNQKDSSTESTIPFKQNNSGYSVNNVNEVEPSNALQTVCILNQIPPEFFLKIQSRKWTARRDALKTLETILTQPMRIENGNFTELTKILTNVISKDTNIAVVSLAIKSVTALAIGLRTDFGPYVSGVFKVLLEKLKEKKNAIVCPLRDAMDVLFKCSSLDTLSTDLIGGLRNKNPNVKSESALFLSRCFSLLSTTDLNRKAVEELVVSLKTAVNDQDPVVRDSASHALGVVVRIAGEKKLSNLLGDVDHKKMAKIREYACSIKQKTFQQESTAESSKHRKETSFTKSDASRSGDNLQVRNMPSVSRKNDVKITQKTKNVLNLMVITPVASSKCTSSKESLEIKIPEAVIAGMLHENWAVRLQAISDLLESTKKTHQIPTNFRDIVQILSLRILDNNPKTAKASISLVSVFAEKMESSFTDHVPTFVPPLLKCTGNSKKWVSEQAIECLDSLSKHCGYGEVFKSESLIEVLKSGSQISRIRLWQWVSTSLHRVTLKDISKELLEQYLIPLFISLEDRNTEIRNNASRTCGVLIKLLGHNTVLSISESYFKGHKNPLSKLFDKSQIFKVGPISYELKDCSSHDSTFCKETNIASKKSFRENEGRSPLLKSNNLKHQRVIDEQKNKIAKWEFISPRAEFVDLLKSLMSAANFGQTLMYNMYHNEFKYQLAAMDMLLEELQHNSQAVMSNLDLILRWLTLRFFDTCPIVLGKALDFLFVTIEILKSNNYCLLDCEASILVPYVVLKMADPKEKIQNKAKDILLKLSGLYPASKMKKFIMDGLRTKSVRQKVNCLEVLNSIIDTYGEAAYTGDLDVMAEQIVKLLRDRDSDIKKTALSVAASLFSQEEKQMLKFIDKYAGKDGPIFEQKMRKFATARKTMSNILPLQTVPSTLVGSYDNKQSDEVMLTSNEVIPESNGSLVAENPAISSAVDANSGMFKLDQELLEELDSVVNMPLKCPKVVGVDIEFLNEAKHKPWESFKLLHSSPNLQEHSNEDFTLSIRAMHDIDDLFKSEKSNLLLVHIDSIVQKIAQQLGKLAQNTIRDKLNCFEMPFTLLLTVFSTKSFVDQISRSNLCYVLEQVLLLISNNIFDGTVNANYRAAVNTIIEKILQNGRKTDLLCGLLEMMGDSKDTTSVARKMHELQMKCIWKLNRSQPSWDGELDYTEVFKSIRTLIQTFNFPWWTSKITNYSLRTMKTVMLTMVRMRGERVFNDAKINLSSGEDYGLHIYLRKLLKSRESKKKDGLDVDVWPRQESMIHYAQELSDIFKAVSAEPTNGMERLNKFRDDHPDIALYDILSKVSPNVLKYSLWCNEKSHLSDDTSTAVSVDSAKSPMSRDEFSKEVQNMWNKLKVLQERIRCT